MNRSALKRIYDFASDSVTPILAFLMWTATGILL